VRANVLMHSAKGEWVGGSVGMESLNNKVLVYNGSIDLLAGWKEITFKKIGKIKTAERQNCGAGF